MWLESLLAYAHFAAILGVVVFITSEAALCRIEWLNEAVVRRLVRVDVIYLTATFIVLLTGLARPWWGIKGTAWYWHQPLLHVKVTLFVVIVLMAIPCTLAFRRWLKQLNAKGTLPDAADVRRVRRLVMIQAHIMLLIPLAASLLARGIWTR